MSLYLYTRRPHSYFSLEAFKRYARFVLRKSRGPQAVDDSIIRGLKEIGCDYRLNDPRPVLDGKSTFFINDSLDALRWAVNLKKRGKIGRIVAGPNLVTLPEAVNHIIESLEIDKIILPSQWILDLWKMSGFKLENKVRIWPAGVNDFGERRRAQHLLLYKKDIPEDIYSSIKEVVEMSDPDFKEIVYGGFSREEYFSLLDESTALVYVQKSESQGISLLEAWMKDVPTFVFSHGRFQSGNLSVEGDEIAAPYLTRQSGKFFHNASELSEILKDLSLKAEAYQPRRFYLDNFTDQICAEKLLAIINEDNK